MANKSFELAEEIEVTRTELDKARTVVRDLANELADVADVIGPVLDANITRLRQARMSTIEEIRQITAGLREAKQSLLSNETNKAIENGERLIRVLSDISALQNSSTVQVDISVRR